MTAPPAFGQPQQLTVGTSELMLQVIGLLGIPYRAGGNLPEQGFDCSGLVRHVFGQAWGMALPRTAEEISRIGVHVDQQDLEAGDLVFYNTLQRSFSHVGIYLGDHRFIHSPSAGGSVRIEEMDSHYWRQRFDGARRISAPAME